MSPFRQNQQQILAALASPELSEGLAPEIDGGSESGVEYRALLTSLHADLHSLRDIASVLDRNPVKAQKAVTYASWVDGALEAGKSGHAVQDEILMTMMIWAKDYGDFDRALTIAEHAVAHGLSMPRDYSRTAGCFIAEDIATMANEHANQDGSVVPHAVLVRTEALVQKIDMPDQAKAKLYKALGRSYARKAEDFDPQSDNMVAGGQPALVAAALDALLFAVKLDASVGVKKDIQALDKKLSELGGRPVSVTSAEE